MSKIAFLNPNNPKEATRGARGMRGFFLWLRQTQPALHAKAVGRIESQGALAGLGLTTPTDVTSTEGPVSSSVADKIKDVLLGLSSAYLGVQQVNAQKKLLDVQLQRAQQGLAPLNINPADYGVTGPTMNVGLTGDTQKMLMYGGLALVAVIVLMRVSKR